MKNKLAYIAGYIDGDGCFFIFKESKPIRYRAQIIISSTNKKVLESFKKQFKGQIRMTSFRYAHWKRTYHWMLRGIFALEFTFDIEKYLLEKRGDSRIFKRFIQTSCKLNKQELISNMKKHRDEVREINEEVVEKLRKIHPRGIHKEEECAYLAGFIDAECCLGISTYKPKNRPNFTYKIVLQCQNTNPIIFYWLMRRVGGSICHVKRNHKNPRHRDQIIWNLSGKTLAKLLPKILPFLRNKKKVCEKLIEFYNTTLKNGGDRQSDEFTKSYQTILSHRELLVKQIHKLNSKGITNV